MTTAQVAFSEVGQSGDKLNHLLKLAVTQGRDDEVLYKNILKQYPKFPVQMRDWLSIAQVASIMSAGFRIFVGWEFVCKYKYAALFNMDEEQQVVGMSNSKYDVRTGVYYSGDVPDYILDRVEIVKRIDSGEFPWAFLTVSKYPIPIQTRTIDVVKQDPVMIAFPAGAKAHPLQIFTDVKGKILKNEDSVSGKEIHSWCFYSNFAFVVGAWGNEPEFD